MFANCVFGGLVVCVCVRGGHVRSPKNQALRNADDQGVPKIPSWFLG